MKRILTQFSLLFLFSFSQAQLIVDKEDLKWVEGAVFTYDFVKIDTSDYFIIYPTFYDGGDFIGFWDLSDSASYGIDSVTCVENNGVEVIMESTTDGVTKYNYDGTDFSYSKVIGREFTGDKISMCFPHQRGNIECESEFIYDSNMIKYSYDVVVNGGGKYVHNGETVDCIVVSEFFIKNKGSIDSEDVFLHHFETKEYGRVATFNEQTYEFKRLKTVSGTNQNSVSKIGQLNTGNFYPNPSADLIYFQGIDNVGTFKIFNSLGVLIHIEENPTSVSLRHLTNGIYFVEIDGVRSKLFKN